MSSRPVPREETLNRRALSSSIAIEGGEVENETLHGWRIVAYKVWRRQLLTLLLLLSLSLFLLFWPASSSKITVYISHASRKLSRHPLGSGKLRRRLTSRDESRFS